MLSKERSLKAYEKMFLIRNMEEKLVKYYFDNKIMSFGHVCIGQEAVAVGVCENLELGDKVFGNHRSHGHYLAKGGNPGRMVAELLGKSTGCCKGKGGSMHMIDKSVNFMGSTPILGSVVPITVGSALTQKLKKSNNISVCFIGDGASEEGVVYESYNFAALMKLPILIVIENNYYAVMSKLKDRRSINYNLEEIVKGFDLDYISADGNDFLSVYEKAKEAINIIKNKNRAVILECFAFRHMAHSAPITDDKIGYREIDTIEERAKADAVINFKNQILAEHQCDQEVLTIETNINKLVDESIQFAIDSPFPNQQEIFNDLYHG